MIENQSLIRDYESYIKKKRLALLATLIIGLAAAVYSIGLGSIPMTLTDILQSFVNKADPMIQATVLNIRLPRLVAAVLVGAGLAAAGAVMQCVLQNPLASASTLGVSQGRLLAQL